MYKTLNQLGIAFKQEVPLKQLTGINQAGQLPLVAYPSTQSQMIDLCKIISSTKDTTYEIFGGLTNTYLCESFQRDIVIFTTRYNSIHINQATDNVINVESGCSLTKIAKLLVKNGVKGYEGLVGIPGTIGAAAINNSGAFGCSMSNVVLGVLCISIKNGKLIYFNNAELQYKKRNSILKGQNQYLVLSVDLDIQTKVAPQTVISKMYQNIEVRRTKIDGKRKSLGTIFIASSMNELYNRHRIATIFGKILNIPNKLLFHRHDWDIAIRFFCLGHLELAKHCDSIGRFCWDENTTERDFFHYIKTMQSLACGQLELEIEIKK